MGRGWRARLGLAMCEQGDVHGCCAALLSPTNRVFVPQSDNVADCRMS